MADPPARRPRKQQMNLRYCGYLQREGQARHILCGAVCTHHGQHSRHTTWLVLHGGMIESQWLVHGGHGASLSASLRLAHLRGAGLRENCDDGPQQQHRARVRGRAPARVHHPAAVQQLSCATTAATQPRAATEDRWGKYVCMVGQTAARGRGSSWDSVPSTTPMVCVAATEAASAQ
jgi:hypothetical protein